VAFTVAQLPLALSRRCSVASDCAALRCAALRCAALRCAALRCAALRCYCPFVRPFDIFRTAQRGGGVMLQVFGCYMMYEDEKIDKTVAGWKVNVFKAMQPITAAHRQALPLFHCPIQSSLRVCVITLEYS
jgi:hypothetical protein